MIWENSDMANAEGAAMGTLKLNNPSISGTIGYFVISRAHGKMFVRKLRTFSSLPCGTGQKTQTSRKNCARVLRPNIGGNIVYLTAPRFDRLIALTGRIADLRGSEAQSSVLRPFARCSLDHNAMLTRS